MVVTPRAGDGTERNVVVIFLIKDLTKTALWESSFYPYGNLVPAKIINYSNSLKQTYIMEVDLGLTPPGNITLGLDIHCEMLSQLEVHDHGSDMQYGAQAARAL